MNARDRRAIERMDAVLREMASLSPPNPTDTKAIFANLRIAVDGSRSLSRAITAMRAADWTAVDEHLSEAERVTSREGVR